MQDINHAVINISDWTVEQRNALLDVFMADLCPSSQEDFDWASEHYGQTVDMCLDLFRHAARICLLKDPGGYPIYLFAYDSSSTPCLSSLSTSRRRDMGFYMTKQIKRWQRRNPQFFDGTYVLTSEDDIDVHFTLRWVHSMGYSPLDTFEGPNGVAVHRYIFQGVR